MKNGRYSHNPSEGPNEQIGNADWEHQALALQAGIFPEQFENWKVQLWSPAEWGEKEFCLDFQNQKDQCGIFPASHYRCVVPVTTHTLHLIPASFCYSDALQCHICCTLIDKFMQNPNKWKELFEFLSISFQCYSYARVQFIWLVKILIHSANLFLVSISELWCQHTPQLNFQTHFSDLIRLNCYRCALLLLLVLEKLLFTEKMS